MSEIEFYGPGIIGLLLETEGRCVFDLGLERGTIHQSENDRIAVRLTILHQPKSSTGLPRGIPCRILQESTWVFGIASEPVRWGRIELPENLPFDLLKNCYFVVTCLEPNRSNATKM